MGQRPSLGDCSAALSQCLVGITETEKDNSQSCLGAQVGMDSKLMDKGVVGDRIVMRGHLFQMRSGRGKPAGNHQVLTVGVEAQNEPSGIMALAALAQQILMRVQREIEFTAVHVIAGLPVGYVKKLQGETE